MRKKSYKGRCEKQSLEKFTTICKTYDPIQTAYANILVKNKDVVEVRCNVALDGDKYGEYMTDFVCTKVDGDLMVRECVSRMLHSYIVPTRKPQTSSRKRSAVVPRGYRHLEDVISICTLSSKPRARIEILSAS